MTSTENIKTYEAIKDQIFVRVCSTASNFEFLINVPHRIVADEIALFYCRIIGEDEDRIFQKVITNQFLEEYGVTEEQIYRDAMENSPMLFPLEFSMLNELVTGAEGEPEVENEESEPGLSIYVLTNEQKTFGASALFYPDVMENLGSVLGEDYIMLPSSIHEVLIIPSSSGLQADALDKIVRAINGAIVDESERLSDCSYYYDRKRFRLEPFSMRGSGRENAKNEAESLTTHYCEC